MATSDTSTLDEIRYLQRRWYRHRREAELVELVALSVGFAILTGIAAQVRIPLPFTPVPITLQTFAVLLAGVVLGLRFGGISQAIYVGAGLGGMPWFTGAGAGLSHLLGPTGGYLVGFVVAAMLIGFVVDRNPRARRLPTLLLLFSVANFIVIYAFGLAWLYVYTTVFSGELIGLVELLMIGAAPFVAGDLAKLVAAAVVASALLPGAPLDGADIEPHTR